MKGILKNTKAGWFVLYQVMKDEITSGYDSIPLHPDNEESLIEGNEVEFDIITVEEPYYLFAEIINKDALGCSYPNCICQGDEITYCNNRTPEQVVLGDKTALVEDVFHQGIENKHTQQVDFSNPNADKITSTSTTSMKQETLEEVAKRIYGSEPSKDVEYYAFINGAKWKQEQILQFLYSELIERRPYSSSKMCEVVIEFIEQLNNKK